MANATATILMYHALLDETGACEGADPHYAVGRRAFEAQLALVAGEGLRPASVRDILADGGAGRVGFTFDDGHESNAAAARRIVELGGGADLFVVPARVGARHHLDWNALAGLAREGISIQSHGYTHRYFNEMSAADIEDELSRSKGEIESRVGLPVSLFAPPGGRLGPSVAAIALRLGYRAVCTSRAGLWRLGDPSPEIPRLAVLRETGEPQFRRWIRQDRWEVSRMALRHRVLGTAKGLLGNRGYERLRAGLLGARSRKGHLT